MRIVWAQCGCHVWPLIDPDTYGYRTCGECGVLPILNVPPTASGKAERLEPFSE